MKVSNTASLVNIPICVYNHEKYIGQTIESILNQKTNFNYLIIIGEDCSSDKSKEIIQYYSIKYPEKIKCIFHSKNLGAQLNSLILFNECSAKYIALCDGDDYWTDPLKLQKQVDFLEANEDYSICCHRVYELGTDESMILSSLNNSERKEYYTIQDLAEGNFIHTASVVFRNGLIKEFPDWFFKSPVGDYPLHMLNARQGLIKLLHEPMAVYRRNIGSVWGTKTRIYQISNLITVIDFLIQEFNDDKQVVGGLTLQKSGYEQEIAFEYLRNGQIELFETQFANTTQKRDEYLLKFVETDYYSLLQENKLITQKLNLILQSTTYKFLKKIRIFK